MATSSTQNIYNGFSTVNPKSQKKFTLHNNDLIKQDILNALSTKPGSWVMNPTSGCIVWDKLFSSVSPVDVEDISSNITQIIARDPRVALTSIDVSQNPSNYSLTITLGLKYVSTNEIDTMMVLFNAQ